MTQNREHFAEFEEHTRLKHLVLEKYLGAWGNKLLLWQGSRGRVWFVDAFAGEGVDGSGRPGSPVIAARIADETTNSLRSKVGKESVAFNVLAFERDRRRVEKLKAALASFMSGPDPRAVVRHGTLAERIDNFMAYVGNDPSLFFLDPFGVQGLIADLLPKALRGPSNEIFALFSDTGAVRLHAVLAATERNAEREVAELLAQPSLFEEHDVEAAERKRREIERSVAALKFTQPRAREILVGALGEDGLAEIDRTPAYLRPTKFVEIFMRLLASAGARYVIALPIRDSRNKRAYQLVHASKSEQGFRAMKEAMSSALKRSDLPPEVLESITIDTATDLDAAVSAVYDHFRGETVRWSEGTSRKANTVRNFLLNRTPVFPHELDTVRAKLGEIYVVQKKPLTYKFPK